MKKFVINLKRRPDRLTNFLNNCPYGDVEIVYGFDGKNPTDNPKKEIKIFEGLPKRLQPGARGCWISHLRIWKKIVNENIQTAMIFEDDAVFNEDFSQIINKLVLPTDGIIYFGGRFTKNFIIPPEHSKPVNEYICQSYVENGITKYHERTTHGYIIHFKLAKLFIEIFNNTNSPDAIDQFMIHKLKVLDIPIYNTIPLLCYSSMTGDSDIR